MDLSSVAEDSASCTDYWSIVDNLWKPLENGSVENCSVLKFLGNCTKSPS